MDGLEPKVILRIKDIVDKLQKLDCTLLGNKDDAWIMELLFRPGFHRYSLMEWLLPKLSYDISKISGPENSLEERMQNLNSAILDLGICQDHQVIRGTAEVKKQLEFWGNLIDIIWLQQDIILVRNCSKNSSAAEADQGIASSEKKECVNEEFEKSYSSVRNICKNVNLRQLFTSTFHMFAPDVEREVNNLSLPKAEASKYPTVQEIKDVVENIVYDPVQVLQRYFPGISKDMLADSIKYMESEENSIMKSELDESEEQLRIAAEDFQDIAQKNFSSTYNELKSLVSQVKEDKFIDVGEFFKKLEPNLESLSQFEKSVPQLMTSQSKVLELTSDLDNLRVMETLSDEKYENILKLVKD